MNEFHVTEPSLSSHAKEKPWKAEFVSMQWVSMTENVTNRKY